MKSAYAMKHVKGTTAIALIKDGQLAGKIVANWSDNPAGSVCTATVHILHDGHWFCGTGRARGYGYDKLSSATYEALRSSSADHYERNKEAQTINRDLSNVINVYPGAGNQRQAFEDAGYQYVGVC